MTWQRNASPGLQYLNNIKAEKNLTNIWRKNKPNKKYIHYIHSRIDRTYISKDLITKTCKMIPTAISNPEGITVPIKFKKTEPKGPGCWKLNNLF